MFFSRLANSDSSHNDSDVFVSDDLSLNDSSLHFSSLDGRDDDFGGAEPEDG